MFAPATITYRFPRRITHARGKSIVLPKQSTHRPFHITAPLSNSTRKHLEDSKEPAKPWTLTVGALWQPNAPNNVSSFTFWAAADVLGEAA